MPKQTRGLRLNVLFGQGLGQKVFAPRLIDEKVYQTGMRSIYDKFPVSIIPKAVLIIKDRNRPRPILISAVNAPIPIFLADSVRKHIESAVKSKLGNDLFCGVAAETIIAVVVPDGIVDGIPAGNVRLVARTVNLQFIMLMGVSRRIYL